MGGLTSGGGSKDQQQKQLEDAARAGGELHTAQENIE